MVNVNRMIMLGVAMMICTCTYAGEGNKDEKRAKTLRLEKLYVLVHPGDSYKR